MRDGDSLKTIQRQRQRGEDFRRAGVVRTRVERERDRMLLGREAVGDLADEDAVGRRRSRFGWLRLRHRVCCGQRDSCRGRRAGGRLAPMRWLRAAANTQRSPAGKATRAHARYGPCKIYFPGAKYCSIALASAPAITCWP